MSQVKKFGEVFTPQDIVDKLLVGIDYSDPTVTICEPSFGMNLILDSNWFFLLKNDLNH